MALRLLTSPDSLFSTISIENKSRQSSPDCIAVTYPHRGSVISIYTPTSEVNFLWSNNDVSVATELTNLPKNQVN